jgi:hypothetical protein
MKVRSWLSWMAIAALVVPWIDLAARRRAAMLHARRVLATRDADRPDLHREELSTYQSLLDESLSLTFPASDPVCATAATHCGDPCDTPANGADWRLDPGSRLAAAGRD